MGASFNPLISSGFDSKGSSSATATKYTSTFLIADWVGPVSSAYTLTVLASTHGKGTSPEVEVYELVSGSYSKVEIETLTNVSGDVTIRIASSPDVRFDGKYLIV